MAFEPTASVLALAIPGVAVGGSCLILKTLFEGSGQANIVPQIQIMPVAFRIVLAYVLINRWGLQRAAIALALGSTFFG